MPQENRSEIFIRLLNDAWEADCLIRKSRKSNAIKDNAKQTHRLFQPDIDNAMHAFGPLDCVQLMASGPAHSQNC